MKHLIKTLVISSIVVGLTACSKPAPMAPVQNKPVMTAMAHPMPVAKKDSMKECRKVKKELRHLDRAAPNAQAKVSALEAKLDTLNCGVK